MYYAYLSFPEGADPGTGSGIKPSTPVDDPEQ